MRIADPLTDVLDEIDLAMVSVPVRLVPGAREQCGQKKGNVINIIMSGGEKGRATPQDNDRLCGAHQHPHYRAELLRRCDHGVAFRRQAKHGADVPAHWPAAAVFFVAAAAYAWIERLDGLNLTAYPARIESVCL